MTNDEFIAEFGHLAAAPGGTERLRQTILDLAVRGRLVERNPQDEPPRASLRFDSGREFGLPCIPAHWVWTSLGSVASYIQRGKSPAYADAGQVTVVSQKCVRDGYVDLGPARCIRDETIGSYKSERFLQAGDILWNSTGDGTVGRSAVYRSGFGNPPVVADSHVTVIRLGDALADFVQLWLAATWVQTEVVLGARGSTKQTELNLSVVKATPVPLPPLPEQHRIVARVDELIALCDELEERQAQAVERRAATARSALAELVDLDRSDTDRALRLVEEHVRLCLTPGEGATEVLARVRQAILDLAVRGRLVPAEPASESVADLRDRSGGTPPIPASREQAAPPAPGLTVAANGVPHAIPGHWGWIMLGAATSIGTRGTAGPDDLEGDTWVLDLEDVARDSGEVLQRVTAAERRTSSTRTRFAAGDVLFGKLRPYLNKVVVADSAGCCTTEMLVLTASDVLVPDYLGLSLRCPSFVAWSTAATHGVKMPRLGTRLLQSRLVAVPPLVEQERIVARVGELLALCDQSEAALLGERDVARTLAASSCVTVVRGGLGSSG